MNLIKKVIFSTPNIKPNTFLKGVGAYYTSKDILANKLQISTSSIKSFKVVDNNVECYISVIYDINPRMFTSIVDPIGSVPVNYIDKGRIKILREGAFQGVFSGGSPEGSLYPLKSFYSDSCEEIRSVVFSYARNLEACICPNLLRVSGAYQFNRTKVKNIIFDNVVSVIGDNALGQQTTSEGHEELISLKKCKIIDNVVPITTNSYVFRNIKPGCRILVNDFLRTSFNGQPNDNLRVVKLLRQAIVEFYDDNGNYVSTL